MDIQTVVTEPEMIVTLYKDGTAKYEFSQPVSKEVAERLIKEFKSQNMYLYKMHRTRD